MGIIFIKSRFTEICGKLDLIKDLFKGDFIIFKLDNNYFEA